MIETQVGAEADCIADDLPTRTFEGICSGKMLREARKASGKSIAELAERTCIKSEFLEAMEAGKRDALPERAFTLGFVRSYAETLGLDGCEVVEAFKAEFDEQIVPEPEIDPIMMKGRPSARPWLFALALPLAGALAFAGASYTGQPSDAIMPAMAEIEAPAEQDFQTVRQDQVQADPGRLVVTEVSASASSQVAAKREEMLAVKDDMVLTASEDSWLQLASDDGQSVWTGVLLAGESRTQPVSDAVYLTTGNAGGLSLEWGGRTPQALGERGAIVRNLALTPALLGSRFSENR